MAYVPVDSNGNMTTLTPPGKPEHGFSYNSANRIDGYTPPVVVGSGKTSFEYNLAKQPTLVTGSDGKTLGYEYDTMGRLVTLTLPDGEIAYTYDSNTGRLNNIIAKDDGAISYTYDGSLLTKTTWAGTIKGNISETYNNDFVLESQSVNGSNAVNFTYDNDGLLKTVDDLSYTRKVENGLITGTTYGNVNDSVAYNSFGEVIDYVATCQNVGIFEEHCTFDKLGRVDTRKEVVNRITVNLSYSYDNGGRLTDVYRNGVLATHYDYDDNGNRVTYSGEKGNLSTADIVYDAQDRLLKYGQNEYQYTADGELQQKVVEDKTTCYTYDVLGSLTSVILPDGTKIEYITDGKNRRIGKKINGNLVWGFLYQDSLHPIAELDSSGNVIARFVYGEQVNVPEYMIKGGVKYRITSDRLGSPRVVINAETGEIAQRLDYDEYGNVTLDTNPGFQPFGFAGGIYDKDTGLVHFGARDYDAETGRWTCQDPIGFAGGSSNLYKYVGDDPVNNVDPSGLLFGGLIPAGEEYGEQAAQFWADMSIDQSRPGWQRGLACVAGCFAELWTPCTSDTTFAVLTTAWGAGEWAGRPFWRYVGENSNPASPWLTRGLGWEAPYGTDFNAAKEALQLPNMPTDVIPVKVNWWEYISGPREVWGNEQWGIGGGIEYFRGWGFPN